MSSTVAAGSPWLSGSSRARQSTASTSGPTSSTSSTAASTATRSRRSSRRCAIASRRSRADLLLELADDELILGWRDSEWTGIAPFLEEDVAFSSISQNEIGHARALYELAAAELGTTADALALDRAPEDYRCAPLVELRRLEWARTIARHWLYETADEVRLEALIASSDREVAALAAKIDREEVYHRMHAEMWLERLLGEEGARAKLEEALAELWPYALGVLDDELRPIFVERVEAKLPFTLPDAEPISRGQHTAELAELLTEMTMVRRSAPAGSEW